MYLRPKPELRVGVDEVGKPSLSVQVFQTEVYEEDWQIPNPFNRRSESAGTVVTYWTKTYCDATGSLPNCPMFAMVKKADLLIAKLGFKAVMQTLAFMSSPHSKYFQFPYTLNVVMEAYEEMLMVRSNGPKRTYKGFIGKTLFRNLGGWE